MKTVILTIILTIALFSTLGLAQEPETYTETRVGAAQTATYAELITPENHDRVYVGKTELSISDLNLKSKTVSNLMVNFGLMAGLGQDLNPQTEEVQSSVLVTYGSMSAKGTYTHLFRKAKIQSCVLGAQGSLGAELTPVFSSQTAVSAGPAVICFDNEGDAFVGSLITHGSATHQIDMSSEEVLFDLGLGGRIQVMNRYALADVALVDYIGVGGQVNARAMVNLPRAEGKDISGIQAGLYATGDYRGENGTRTFSRTEVGGSVGIQF